MLMPSMPVASARSIAACTTRSLFRDGRAGVEAVAVLTALRRTVTVSVIALQCTTEGLIMKAVRHVGYGDPGRAMRLEEAEMPVAGDKQVLVRVKASSINAGDWRAVYARPFF